MREKNRSIDGFVTYKPNRGAQTPTLGQFRRQEDGFHPARPAAPGGIAGTAADDAEREALLEEPIVLDDLPYEKRKDKLRGKIKRARLKKILKRTSLALLILLIAGGVFLGYKFYRTKNTLLAGGGHAPAVCDGNVPLDLVKREGDGRVNILLAGIGSEGLLTDTIMIASLDPFTDKIELLSVPRDLWVNIPNNGQEKINAAYEFGWQKSTAKSGFEKRKAGAELLDKVLEDVTGVTIHYHAVFDFSAFKQIVNALGGVTVNVPETLYDPTIAWENNYNPVIATKGVQQFSGSRALLYAKSRQTSSDFARAERQRLLLVAIQEKALSAGTFSNPVRIVQLLNSLGKNVYSDFDTESIQCLYRETSQVQSHNIKSLDLVTPPNDLLTTGPHLGRSIVRPKAGLFEYGQLHNFIRKTFRDGFLAKENASVAIYNATATAGLATKSADTLKSYGYNVTVVDNAPNITNPPTTVVIDLSKGVNKYTRHYLERRFSVSATSSIPGAFGVNPPEGTAFVIILGVNANTLN